MIRKLTSTTIHSKDNISTIRKDNISN